MKTLSEVRAAVRAAQDPCRCRARCCSEGADTWELSLNGFATDHYIPVQIRKGVPYMSFIHFGSSKFPDGPVLGPVPFWN